MFTSTRSRINISASEAIIDGLAPDGGLYVPVNLDQTLFSRKLFSYSYKDLAKYILKYFLDDFTDDEISSAVEKAYNDSNFPNGVADVKSFKDFSFLELFKGPTLAFKDIGLTILPYLIKTAREKNKDTKKLVVLTATSGDTGSAALSGFSKELNSDVIVLYPSKGISEIQERQMLYYSDFKHTYAYAIEGDFDYCQKMVKTIFGIKQKNQSNELDSANSINIGRLLPQIVYYCYGYIQLVKNNSIKWGDQITVDVPTGNFGDIFAGYLASRIGVPIKNFICACNSNSVLDDFFKTGKYDANRKLKHTDSPSMDITVSSNLERLIYYISDGNYEYVKKLMSDLNDKGFFIVKHEYMINEEKFISHSSDDMETEKSISSLFEKTHYLIDPHTAVGYSSFLYVNKQKEIDSKVHTLIVSTASPYKFPRVICSALGIMADDSDNEFNLIDKIYKKTGIQVPDIISSLKSFEIDRKTISRKTLLNFLGLINHRSRSRITIKVPSSSANLGTGFDFAGIALDLNNQFMFSPSDNDVLIGFNKAFSSFDKNLVYKSFKYVCSKYKADLKISIKLEKSSVPVSHGLGSSGTCIVAGVLAANYYLRLNLDKEELVSLMALIEGHPDNVAASFLGGLVLSYKKEELFISHRYQVSKKLNFVVGIPDFNVLTKDARGILPLETSYKEAVYNASRSSFIPIAFATGDIKLIKDVFNDTIHSPYRIKMIADGPLFNEDIRSDNNTAMTISGSGPTLLFVTIDDPIILISHLEKIRTSANWKFKKVIVNLTGSIIKEEKI